jgi:hypothetical protein
MAKAKRWLVRYEAGYYGLFCRAHKPRKSSRGWEFSRKEGDEDLCMNCVHELLPPTCHLPPGGGPVELKT